MKVKQKRYSIQSSWFWVEPIALLYQQINSNDETFTLSAPHSLYFVSQRQLTYVLHEMRGNQRFIAPKRKENGIIT